jgi:hypothetical protein
MRLAMSPRIVASLCAVLLVLLSSCDLGSEPKTNSSTRPPSNAVCLDAQRDAFPGLVAGWRKVAIEMTAAGSVASTGFEPWTTALDKARASLTKAGCPDPPRELEPLTALTDDLKSSGQMTVEQARSLGGLLSELRKTLQVSPTSFDERLLDLPMTCEEISKEVTATYAARSVRTRSGRDVWAIISVRNKSSRGVYVAVDGQLAASGARKGEPERVSWESTTPGVYAGPLRTSQHPLLAPGGERMHLTSDGRPTSLAVNASVGFSAGQADGCPIRASRTGGSKTVAVAGDIACDPQSHGFNGGRGVPGYCHQKATSDLVKKMKPDAVFALGDLQYQAGSLANFQESYDPTWGRFKNITYPVLGDHEYGSPGAEGYFAYFGSRATPQDPDCTASCRAYYSFNLGAWHVVAVNVNCEKLPSGDGCGQKSPQNRWLERDLKSAKATTACTVVLMHEPRWSNSRKQSPDLNPLVKTMYRNGVDLLLSGDSHAYERFAPQTPASTLDKSRGLTQIVVGTGGAHFTGLHTPRPNKEVSATDIFGVLELTLRDGSYKWNFRADPSTPFKDSGSQDCH